MQTCPRWHILRSFGPTVKIYLSVLRRKIQKTPRTTESCRLYGVKNCYNILFRALKIHGRLSGGGSPHALGWHSEKPTDVNITSTNDTWYSHFRKHGFFRGFAVQISVASSISLFRSLSFGLRHREVIESSAPIQNSEGSGGTESFVFCFVFFFPARNRAFEASLRDDS